MSSTFHARRAGSLCRREFAGRPLAHHREDFVARTVGLGPTLRAHVGSLGGGAAVAGWIAELAWLAEVAGGVPYASSMSWSSARV